MPLTPDQLLLLIYLTNCRENTILRYFAGMPCYGATYLRMDAALRSMGLSEFIRAPAPITRARTAAA